MVSAIIYQLTRNLSTKDIKRSGFDTYFVDHSAGSMLHPLFMDYPRKSILGECGDFLSFSLAKRKKEKRASQDKEPERFF